MHSILKNGTRQIGFWGEADEYLPQDCARGTIPAQNTELDPTLSPAQTYDLTFNRSLWNRKDRRTNSEKVQDWHLWHLKAKPPIMLSGMTGTFVFGPEDGAIADVARLLIAETDSQCLIRRNRFQDGLNDIAALQIINGYAAGAVTVRVTKHRSGHDSIIMGAYVHPEFRRKGVMTNLWKALYAETGPMGVSEPTLDMVAWVESLIRRIETGEISVPDAAH